MSKFDPLLGKIRTVDEERIIEKITHEIRSGGGSSGGGLTTDTTDGLYLKLDASNGPVIGNLAISVAGTQGFTTVNTSASGSGAGAGIQVRSNDGATMASGDRLGFVLFGGYDGSAEANSAGITAFATEAWAGSARGSEIRLETVPNLGTSRAIGLTVHQDANVGIGTTTAIPAQSQLDVSRSTGGVITLSRNDLSAASGDSLGKIQFWNNDTQLTTQNIFGYIEGLAGATVSTDAAAGAIRFATTPNTVGASPVERMRILPQGTLAINLTTDGDAMFHVGGIHTDTATAVYGFRSSVAAPATATSISAAFLLEPKTDAAAFTLANLQGLRVSVPNVGAGSTVTTMEGIYIRNQGLAGITTSYGMRIEAQTGATNSVAIAVEGGNVGIGTTSAKLPQSLLDVSSATGGIITLSRRDTAVGSPDVIGKIQFWNDDSQLTSRNIYADIEVQAATSIGTDAPQANMIFRTSGSTAGADPIEVMRLSSTQRIGIGVNPSFKLHLAETLTTTSSVLLNPTLADHSGVRVVTINRAESTITSDNSNYIIGFQGEVWVNAASTANYTSTTGLVGTKGRVETRSSSTGTITHVKAFESDIERNGASITNAYHYFIKDSAGSTATNLYGVYVSDLVKGTNNYGIYFAGTSGLSRQGIWWNGDTNLFRSAADTLKTDDSLIVGTNLTVAGTSLLSDTITIADAKNIVLNATTGTKIGTATTQKLGFWNVNPVAQPATTAYTPDTESVAYTGIDNVQVGTVYAQLTDLNVLRIAYDNLRASYDDLLAKLKTTGIVS